MDIFTCVLIYTELKFQALVARNFFSSWKSKHNQQPASLAVKLHSVSLLHLLRLPCEKFPRSTSYHSFFLSKHPNRSIKNQSFSFYALLNHQIKKNKAKKNSNLFVSPLIWEENTYRDKDCGSIYAEFIKFSSGILLSNIQYSVFAQ